MTNPSNPYRTEHDSSHFVPNDEYRTAPLPTELRSEVDRYASLLVDYYRQSNETGESYQDLHDDLMDELAAEHGKWWTAQSERTVIGLGETFAGAPIYTDHHTGVVIKYAMSARLPDRTYDTPRGNGNLAELSIWEYVTDQGLDEWFGTVLDYADDGAWVAMKEYIPYYRHSRPTHTATYVMRSEAEYQYGNVLQGALQEADAGIDLHLKSGNVGLDPLPDGGFRPVSIDYTAHTAVDALDWTH